MRGITSGRATAVALVVAIIVGGAVFRAEHRRGVGCASSIAAEHPADRLRRPDLVDLQPFADAERLSQIADQGVLFDDTYVNTSLCCPSRSQMLTGLYATDTDVSSNFDQLERPTLVQALHDSGYRTLLAGKYLNSWPSCDPRPEFDRSLCVSGEEPSGLSLLNPYINVDGTWTQFTRWQTDILSEQAADFINTTPADQPFFVMYTPMSPHLPADEARGTRTWR